MASKEFKAVAASISRLNPSSHLLAIVLSEFSVYFSVTYQPYTSPKRQEKIKVGRKFLSFPTTVGK